MINDIDIRELSGELVDFDPSNPETYLTFEELIELYSVTEEDIQQKDSL